MLITLEDWAEVRRLHRAEGVAIKEIARRLGVGRNTVRRALASDEPQKSPGSTTFRPDPRGALVTWNPSTAHSGTSARTSPATGP